MHTPTMAIRLCATLLISYWKRYGDLFSQLESCQRVSRYPNRFSYPYTDGCFQESYMTHLMNFSYQVTQSLRIITI
jgi:hypothetical protein